MVFAKNWARSVALPPSKLPYDSAKLRLAGEETGLAVLCTDFSYRAASLQRELAKGLRYASASGRPFVPLHLLFPGGGGRRASIIAFL